ncbi:uncharacterized protein LOC119370461 [Jatropha curcas]|uniref:uncharacterized protein LOC119370461 n=1 Tax=Jatropha curcas TaxID=180498 RepID=UPI001895FEE3|nr:uncharacterized protein LOC119370461 [Jatropha curcas]
MGCRTARGERLLLGGIPETFHMGRGHYGITAMLKVAWEKICADRYADFTYRMRRSGKKQRCVSQEIWESWQKAWEDPAFKRKREMFAQNRRSETGGDGAGPSRHTGGSISAIETARLLAKELGREPTPIHRWRCFTYTSHEGPIVIPLSTDVRLSVNEKLSLTARSRIVYFLRPMNPKLSPRHYDEASGL